MNDYEVQAGLGLFLLGCGVGLALGGILGGAGYPFLGVLAGIACVAISFIIDWKNQKL